MRTAGEIRRRPTSAIPMLRGAVIRLWVARGAGFYGLGYIMAFIVLEVHLITSELAESTGVSDFITSQALEYVLRVGFMSFVNGFLALLWPVYVLDLLGGLGILVLIGGYLAFEHVLKPVIERQLPELKAAREQAERTKQRTAETRKQKKGKAGKAAKSRGD